MKRIFAIYEMRKALNHLSIPYSSDNSGSVFIMDTVKFSAQRGPLQLKFTLTVNPIRFESYRKQFTHSLYRDS